MAACRDAMNAVYLRSSTYLLCICIHILWTSWVYA